MGVLTDTWEQNCTAHPELKTLNPYKLIRRFEDAIKPPEPKPLPTQTRPNPANDNFHPDGPRRPPIGELLHIVGQGFNRVMRPGVADTGPATIDGIFDAVEEMVKTRQRNRAISLIERRKATVAGWKRELDNPGSTRRPSPKGKGHQRDGSDLSVSHRRPLPRLTNGSRSTDNGEGSSRGQGGGRSDERPQPESSNFGQPVRNQDGGSNKGKGKGRAHAVELSSESTRRPRANDTAASTVSQERQTMRSAAPRAGSSNESSNHTVVGSVNGVKGPPQLHFNFDQGEDSWRPGDDSWGKGPRR